MKVWCVFGGIVHTGCADNWLDMDETDLEKIFSSKEKAEQYIQSLEMPCDYLDGKCLINTHLSYDEELGQYMAPDRWGDEIVYYIREMEVE